MRFKCSWCHEENRNWPQPSGSARCKHTENDAAHVNLQGHKGHTHSQALMFVHKRSSIVRGVPFKDWVQSRGCLAPGPRWPAQLSVGLGWCLWHVCTCLHVHETWFFPSLRLWAGGGGRAEPGEWPTSYPLNLHSRSLRFCKRSQMHNWNSIVFKDPKDLGAGSGSSTFLGKSPPLSEPLSLHL